MIGSEVFAGSPGYMPAGPRHRPARTSDSAAEHLLERPRHRVRLLLAALAAVYGGYSWYRGRRRRSHRSEPLLLADFPNTTGEAVFDGALKDALEIQLRQSPYLNVVPASQVRSTLQLMERSPNEPVRPRSPATSASASASRR